MRKIVLIVLLFCIVKVNAQWTEIYNGTNKNNNFKGVSFINPSSGYVVSTNYLGFTTDSGKTFTKILNGSLAIDYNGYFNVSGIPFYSQGVKALSTDSVFIYGNFGLEPSILFTSNGGNTWKLVYHRPLNIAAPFSNEGITDLKINPITNIYYAVHNEEIIVSTNKGQTWNIEYTKNNGQLRKLAIAGYIVYAISKTEIFKSLTLGSWSATNLPPLPPNTYRDFTDISFTSLYSGYVTGNGFLYKVDYSNNTWTQTNYYGYVGTKINFINDSVGYTSGGYELYQTINYGKTFELCKRNTNYQYLAYELNDLFFYNNQIAWACGDGEYLLKTTNGGNLVYPKAYFDIDTTGIVATQNVSLKNFSRTGYQYRWIVNGTQISTAYNTSYTHNTYKKYDTISLIVISGTYKDTLTRYQDFTVPPSIISFFPTVAAQGNIVTIKGTGFTNFKDIEFGGYHTGYYRILGDSIILAEVPYGNTGSVRVTTQEGVATKTGFVYCSKDTNMPTIIIAPDKSSICIGSKVTLKATVTKAGTNPVYAWKKNDISIGTNSNTYSDSTLTNKDIISCILQAKGTCAGKIGFDMTMNVNTPPKITIQSDNALLCKNIANLSYSADKDIKNIKWYCNDTLVSSSSYIPINSGKAIIKNTNDERGSIYIDTFGNIYITKDHKVIKYPKNTDTTNVGTVVCDGNNGNQFLDPTSITVDKKGNIYVVDGYKIISYSKNSNQTTLGKITIIDTSSINQITPQAVVVDDSDNIYVKTLSSEIQKIKLDSLGNIISRQIITYNPIIIGLYSNSLTGKGFILTKSKKVYLGNEWYNPWLVSKFDLQTRKQETVAGNYMIYCNTHTGCPLNTFQTGGIFLDSTENLYVTDISNNRILKFPPNSDSSTLGRVIAGNSNSSGNNPSTLSAPSDIFVTPNGDIYIYDAGNSRIQKWDAEIPPTKYYTPQKEGIYKLVADDFWGCSSVSNTIQIGSVVTPTLLISANPNGLISTGTNVTFTATQINGGLNYTLKWYKNGAEIIGETNAICNVNNLNNNDTIYCKLFSQNVCAQPNPILSNKIIIAVSSNAKFNVQGNLINPKNKTIKYINLNLQGTTSFISQTNNLGQYSLDLFSTGNFTLRPTKNNDITKANGVTATDVLFVQRHILGTAKLNNAYRIIAADVDGNKQINATDVLRIKRLILGTDTTFKNTTTNENRLWAFVDSAYQFADTTNPFPFKDSISFTNLTSNKTNQTFIGVKLGDVNFDWNPAVAKGKPVNSLELIVNSEVDKQKNITTKLQTPNNVLIAALQATLHFDNTKYEFVNLEGFKNLQGLSFNASQANETGNIAILWTDKNAEAKAFKEGDELFTVILKPKQMFNAQYSTFNIQLNDEMTNSIAIDELMNERKIILTNKQTNNQQQETPNTKQWLSIFPNPTKGNVTIETIGVRQIDVIDYLGRTISKQSINIQSSILNIKLTKGVYIVKAVMNDGTVKNEKLLVE